MATASKVQLSTDNQPEYYRSGISKEQAHKVSELLQHNHDNYHIFFHPDGLHNHVVHHQLAIWALNASPQTLQKAYDKDKQSQRPKGEVDHAVLEHITNDPSTFTKHLGVRDRYHTFLHFFRNEIHQHGWQYVLQKFVFAGDERADDMLARMYGGFLHPIIHLGYGIEFAQPAIIAEALAQAACHEAWIADFLLPADKKASELRSKTPSKSIADLLDEIHDDDKLKVAAHWEDGNKIRDGIIPRAGAEMIDYAAQFHVRTDELEEKTAEMTNAVCLYTAGAQHPPNIVMYDFYFMHCVNASIFFSAFLKQTWLSDANKARLLEWKVRMDLAMFASRRCPDMRLDEIRSYQPKQPSGWEEIADRVCQFYDDGHAAKLVRALAHGQKICAPYEDKAHFRVKHDDWLQSE